MLSKVHLTSHSRMSGSRWVITPSWLSGSWISFLYSSSVYSCHLFLTSASVNSMIHSMPGLPVHHQIPDSTQTHVHWISDAIQPSHPLSSPSSPVLSLSHHHSLSDESALCIRWPKYWSFSFNLSPSNEHPGLFFFRMNSLDLLAVQRDSQESSPTP